MIADREETVTAPETKNAEVNRFEFALPAVVAAPPDQWWVAPISEMVKEHGYESGTIREQLNASHYTDDTRSATKQLRFLPLERAIDCVADHIVSIVFGKCSFTGEYQAFVHRHDQNNAERKRQGIAIPEGLPRSNEQARRQAAKLFLPALTAHLKGEKVEVALIEAKA